MKSCEIRTPHATVHTLSETYECARTHPKPVTTTAFYWLHSIGSSAVGSGGAHFLSRFRHFMTLASQARLLSKRSSGSGVFGASVRSGISEASCAAAKVWYSAVFFIAATAVILFSIRRCQSSSDAGGGSVG